MGAHQLAGWLESLNLFKISDKQFHSPSGYMLCWGITVPTDAAEGYAPGCIFIHNDGSAGDLFYINEGTKASCDFNSMEAADIALGDTETLAFGTGSDITMNFDGTSFELEGAAAATPFLIGADSYLLNTTLKGTLTVGKTDVGHDVKFWGATAGKYMLWDESEDTLTMQGHILMNATTNITFGATSAGGTGVIRMYGLNSGSLVIGPHADTAQIVTVGNDAQTSGAGIVTIPDLAGGTYKFVVTGVTQSIAGAKTFTDALTVGANTAGDDVKFFGDTTGAYALWDASEDKFDIVKGGMKFSGAMDATEHIMEVTATGLSGKRVLFFGAWGTELNSTGVERIYWKALSGQGTQTMRFVRANTDTTDGAIGAQYYTDCDATTPGPTSLSAADFFVIVNASKFVDTSVSAVDGLHATWHKINADVTATVNSNCMAIWLDNQMHCAIGGWEATIFSSTGGSVPDAWARFTTSSSGWTNLFQFDTTMAGHGPIGAAVNTDAGDSDISLVMEYNGTTYYIPAFAVGGLA